MSDVNPADLPSAGGRALADEFQDDPADLTPEPDVAKATAKVEREGLPPGYRMRADAHYVEQLTSRRADRAERALSDAPRASRRAEPADADTSTADARDRREPRDRRVERLLTQMSEDLSTIEASAALLAADTSPSARRVTLDLVRSHAWRAAFLVRAAAMLEHGPRGVMRPRQLSVMLGQIRDGFAPECRLATFGLHLHAPDWNAMITVDEPAIVTAVTGAVIATLGLIGTPEGATIKVSVAASANELRSIDVSQDEVAVPATLAPRFFDPTWIDRPGGWTAALGAAAARAVAQHHGGEAALVTPPKRGTAIRLTFQK